MNEDLDTDDDD